MKRFVETARWNDPWFRKLSPKMKAFWGYICDVCDPAGVWIVDFELASFFIGETVTEKEAKEALNTRVFDLGNGKWIIPQFISFQYGKLSKDCRPHDRVFDSLLKHQLGFNPDTLSLVYPKATGSLQEEDNTIKDKEEDRKEGGTGGKQNGEPDRKKPKSWPSLAEVLLYADKIGLPPDEAQKFFDHFESTGWTDKNGHPIHDWQSKCRTWKISAEERKFKEKGFGSNGKPQTSAFEEWKKPIEEIK